MATFNPITITNAGEEILAQAVAGDGTLTFTAVSSSSDEESGDLKNITELQNVRQTVAPVIAILEDNTIQLSAVFSNSGLEQGYVVNTLGIYAKIGSEAPVLFAIATATDPDTVPGQNPISPSNFYYQFNIAITDGSNITVSVPEEGSLPASVFYQKFGSANISQIGDGTVTGAIIQNANVAGGDKYDSAKSYAAGDYFIYNDQLCKALTAIASGAALTPGNNYQVTSLENEIAGLNGNIENIFIANTKNNVDYNDLTAGIHYCGTGCSHAPDNYCRVLCLYSNISPAHDALQIAFAVTSPVLYRHRLGDDGTWGEWSKIVFDSN